MRALVWSEKVTRILKSILSRYEKRDALLDNTGVYVCTICGYIYIGDTIPDIFGCKVPNWKFEKIEGGNSMSEKYAVRNIRLCTKDCLCLYVCPSGQQIQKIALLMFQSV